MHFGSITERLRNTDACGTHYKCRRHLQASSCGPGPFGTVSETRPPLAIQMSKVFRHKDNDRMISVRGDTIRVIYLNKTATQIPKACEAINQFVTDSDIFIVFFLVSYRQCRIFQQVIYTNKDDSVTLFSILV